MPTTLQITTITMPCQQMNGESSLPPLSKLNFWHRNGDSGLSEDDELFIGYGHVPSPFPYRMQDMYTRPLQDTEMLLPLGTLSENFPSTSLMAPTVDSPSTVMLAPMTGSP